MARNDRGALKTAVIAIALVIVIGGWFLWPVPPRPEGEHPPGEHKHGGDPEALIEGAVLSIDQTARTVTMEHGPIPHFGLQGTTMAFRITDWAAMSGIKVGDRVRFKAVLADGVFAITSIAKVQ